MRPAILTCAVAIAAAAGCGTTSGSLPSGQPPKSPYDTIAPGAGPATLTYTAPHGKKRDTALTDDQVSKLATAINALSIVSSGQTWSCPMDNGENAVLSLKAGGHSRAFDIALSGCRFTTVSVDGVPGDTLAPSDRPQALVREYVHAELPPSRPPTDGTQQP